MRGVKSDTTNNAFSNEMRLLLQCFQIEAVGLTVELSEFNDTLAIDWNRFISLTARHRLFPQVNAFSKRYPEIIPAQVQHAIAEQASKNLRRMLSLAGELHVIHQLFENEHIGFIAMKGPLMVQQLYGDYSFRQSRDVDILVQVKHVDNAIGALTQAGYHLLDAYFVEDMGKRDLYMKRENHVRFRHPNKMIFIELHWAVSKYFTSIKTPLLFDHSLEIDVHDKKYRTFPVDDYFVILATHGIYHRYELLFWLYDIAHIMSMPGINYASLLTKAELYNCYTPVKVSMALASSVFGMHKPLSQLGFQKLNNREQFLFNQCFDTIRAADTRKKSIGSKGFLSTLLQRYSNQRYFWLMTDDWGSKKRILLNTLIKPYVWGNDEKLPNSNIVYLLMTQVKWLKMVVMGRMTRAGKLKGGDREA